MRSKKSFSWRGVLPVLFVAVSMVGCGSSSKPEDLLGNGGFDNSSSGWSGNFDFSTESSGNGFMLADITAAGNVGDSSLTSPATIEQGKNYTLKFAGKAEPACDIQAGISAGAGSAFESQALTTAWANYEIPLSAATFGGAGNAFLKAGSQVCKLSIDNVALFEGAIFTDYIYTSDPNLPKKWLADVDFKYGEWSTQDNSGTGVFEGGSLVDADYSPMWLVHGADGKWGSVLAMFDFTAGFASGYDNLEFKVKLGSVGSTVKVAFTGSTVGEKAYDVPTVGTALGNGWYHMEVPMSDFGNVSSTQEFAIFTPSRNTMYLTDIGFN